MKKTIKAIVCVLAIGLFAVLPFQESKAQGHTLEGCSDPWWTTIHYPGGGGICDTNGSKCCGD